MEEKKPQPQKILKSIQAATLEGNLAKEVTVEATFTRGLPSFNIVGLASESIKESKERVKSALLFNHFKFPPLRITLNLAPSDLKKNGSHFDLAIALLIALQNECVDFKNLYIFGELGLDGKIKHTTQLFALILSLATQKKALSFIVPKESLNYLSHIPGVTLYGVSTLQESIQMIQNRTLVAYPKQEFQFDFLELDQKYFYQKKFTLDFIEVKGQTIAKRAALIAASGSHNLLLNGSPGSGKSMIIKRLGELLPPLSHNEILHSALLESLEGSEPSFTPKRAYRHPHHSASKASIFGGGSSHSKIGEVALAHNGLLFFDELPHFSKSILEALREPLEDHKILISRVNSKIEYAANFLFCAAMNPCPCGNLLSQNRECRCSDLEINRYKNRLSDPFLDRIDLVVNMSESKLDDTADMSSEELFTQLLIAFSAQKKRGQKNLNGKLSEADIHHFCQLSEELNSTLNQAITRFSLSLRAVDKIKKVARTIADLENSKEIQKRHLLEAFSYRYR